MFAVWIFSNIVRYVMTMMDLMMFSACRQGAGLYTGKSRLFSHLAPFCLFAPYLSSCVQHVSELFRFLPRDAMLSAVYAVVVCLSVSVSVSVSVTLRYCIKTAKRRITQIMSHDRPGTLVSILTNASCSPSAIAELLVIISARCCIVYRTYTEKYEVRLSITLVDCDHAV